MTTLSDIEALYCDAGTEGNPGPCAYRITDCDGQEIEFGYLGEGTNNYAELAALVRSIALCREHDIQEVWSDSQVALGWVTTGKVGSSVAQRDRLIRLVEAAKALLREGPHIRLRKWPTKERGEIPADFGRKGGGGMSVVRSDTPVMTVEELIGQAEAVEEPLEAAETPTTDAPVEPLPNAQAPAPFNLSLEWEESEAFEDEDEEDDEDLTLLSMEALFERVQFEEGEDDGGEDPALSSLEKLFEHLQEEAVLTIANPMATEKDLEILARLPYLVAREAPELLRRAGASEAMIAALQAPSPAEEDSAVFECDSDLVE